MKRFVMPTIRFFCMAAILTIVALAGINSAHAQSAKMPPGVAGETGTPTGQIAFIRDKNVWTMDANGGHQMKVAEVTNADGRLSWSPDSKRIAFTRSGLVDLRAPDMMGGKHKVYDIFIAYIDSAKTGNTFFWRRLTSELGGRDPEWSHDGNTILFYKDMNANVVNADLPNYQVCLMDTAGNEETVLRKDWRQMGEFFISPTMNKSGEIAFVHFVAQSQGGQGTNYKARGLAKLHKDNFMVPLDSVWKLSEKVPNAVGPSWSPDGKWIAYVSNSMSDPGLYVTDASFKDQYLVFSPPAGASLYTMAPTWSPNSKWLSFATTDGSIWRCDITGNNLKQLSGPGLDWAPAWSKTAIGGGN